MFRRSERGRGVIHTLIGDGAEIKGDLRFKGGCHIDGVVRGNVIADKDPDAFLTISESGFVDGSVRVPQVSLSGKVQGDLYASNTVTLASTAKVVGNVHYELLEMTSGAEINGKLIHENTVKPVASAPAKTAAPAAEQARPITGVGPAKRA
jgi:cytoskeletal protein CcmA (bactofilin family)